MAKLVYFTIFLFFFVLCNLQATTADARKLLSGEAIKKISLSIKSETETRSVDHSESELQSEQGKGSDVDSDSGTELDSEPEHESRQVPEAGDCSGKPCNKGRITCKDPTCECTAIYGEDKEKDKTEEEKIPDCIPKYDSDGDLM